MFENFWLIYLYVHYLSDSYKTEVISLLLRQAHCIYYQVLASAPYKQVVAVYSEAKIDVM